MARSKVPSRAEHARLWAGLDFRDRRRILRSVSRGQRLETRADAKVGIGVARQQQRYWRRVWLLGPVMGLVLVPEWIQVAVTAVLGTALLGTLSAWRLRRARAAEQGNLERLQRR